MESDTGTRQFISWPTIGWVSLLLAVCYAPVLLALLRQWNNDPDMGHGFFVPVIAAAIAWHKRDQIAGLVPKPNWWGLVHHGMGWLPALHRDAGRGAFSGPHIVRHFDHWGGNSAGWHCVCQDFRLSAVSALLHGADPGVLYNQFTFPLQQIASSFAETLISWTQIPVVREGNILILPSQSLNVVEACSGIRSLLTLTFFSLVYGYVFEKRGWARTVLFLSTVPITIAANAGRVALTGVVSQINPDLAEGWFHEAQGMVIFVIALAILIGFHQLLIRTTNFIDSRRNRRHA